MRSVKRRSKIRRVGTRPFSGTVFVKNNAVYCEWWPNGRRKCEKFGPASEYDAAVRAFNASLDEARARAGRPNSAHQLTLRELLVRHRADANTRRSRKTDAPLRAATLRLYDVYAATILKYFDGARPAAGLRRGEVRAMVRSCREKGWAEGTIAGVVNYLKMMYRWAVAVEECLDANPLDGLESPSTKGKAIGYTDEEAKKLLDGLLQPGGRDWRFRVTAILAALYGSRISQITGLRWEDVDLDARTITWRQASRGSKGQKDCTMPLLSSAHAVLLEAWNRRAPESPLVCWGWQNHEGEVSYDGMQRALHLLEDRVGVRRVRGRAFHALRRQLATKLARELGPSHAAAWIRDTVDVTVGTYVKVGEVERLATAQHMEQVTNRDKTATLGRAAAS